MTSARGPKVTSLDANALALERTVLAFERTILAWVRTALSLIGFGFTISKFFATLEEQGNSKVLLGPQAIGVIMIVLGLGSMALAIIHMRRFRLSYPSAQRSDAGMLAMTVFLMGIAALVAVLFRF